MENIQIILASITSSTIISGILAFLFRSWISERLRGAIKNEYDHQLETHKAFLKAESEIEIERLKSSLQIEAHKFNIQYTKIFEEIVTTVTEIYGKIVLFQEAVVQYVSIIEWSGGPSKKERREKANEKLQDFLNYYKIKKIYLPRDTVKTIDQFWQGLYEISIDFQYDVEQSNQNGDPINRETWKKAHDYTTKEIPKLLYALEDDLRSIIGTNSNGKTAEPPH